MEKSGNDQEHELGTLSNLILGKQTVLKWKCKIWIARHICYEEAIGNGCDNSIRDW